MNAQQIVITSYSIHYTKLYDFNNNDVPDEVYNKVEEILDKVLDVLGLDDEDSEEDVSPDSENLDI